MEAKLVLRHVCGMVLVFPSCYTCCTVRAPMTNGCRPTSSKRARDIASTPERLTRTRSCDGTSRYLTFKHPPPLPPTPTLSSLPIATNSTLATRVCADNTFLLLDAPQSIPFVVFPALKSQPTSACAPPSRRRVKFTMGKLIRLELFSKLVAHHVQC